MRVDAFFLADALASPPDGKVYVQGGGITKLSPPVLPFVLPQIGVLLRVHLTDDEARQTHRFEIEWTDPDGRPVLPTQEVVAEPKLPLQRLADGEERYLSLALSLAGIELKQPGPHHVVCRIDGAEVRALSLAVVRPSRPRVPVASDRRPRIRGDG